MSDSRVGHFSRVLPPLPFPTPPSPSLSHPLPSPPLPLTWHDHEVTMAEEGGCVAAGSQRSTRAPAASEKGRSEREGDGIRMEGLVKEGKRRWRGLWTEGGEEEGEV